MMLTEENDMNALIAILLPVLIQIESSNNPDAVGDGGDGVGLLQIHKCVVDDVNKFYKTNYDYSDRKDPIKSKSMFRLYARYWAVHYEKSTGQKATLEVIARIWNGGPDGWKKKATDTYWEKVKELLK